MIKLSVLLVVGVIAGYAYGDEPEAIVGGNNARKGQFPYQISLQYNKEHSCGGIIISATHIVTAAHCIEGMNQDQLTVVTGALFWKEDGERHKIKCIRVHSGYTGEPSNGWKDDIALITLESPIAINSFQRPIALPSRDYATGTYRGVISGWGRTNVGEERSPILLYITANVLSQSDCLAAHKKSPAGGPFTNPKHICTLEKTGIGACSSDSGGPLVIDNELVGVVSWAISCAVGVPDVFINVYYYLDFIKESIAMC